MFISALVEILESWAFGKQLKVAAKQDLDYWTNRVNSPNFSIQAFDAFVTQLPDVLLVQWKQRESSAGRSGMTGETQVFSSKYTASLMGMTQKFYCKGYFFTRGKRTGVCIQSFKKA